MTVSVKESMRALADQKDAETLYRLIEQMRADLVAITTKLDSDAGVTDTDYAATLQTTE